MGCTLDDLAEAYAALGMKDEALRCLVEAYREHEMQMVFLQGEPIFDFLHSDPQYRALVNNMGMPAAY